MLQMGFTIIVDDAAPTVRYVAQYFVRLRGGKLVDGDINVVLQSIASDDMRQALVDEAAQLAAFFEEHLRLTGEGFIEVDINVYEDDFDIFIPGFDEVTPLFTSAREAIEWFTGDMDDEPTPTNPAL